MKAGIIKVIAVLAVAMFNVSPAAAKTATALVDNGNQAYQKGDYTGAINSYAEAAVKAPESAVIHFDRGNALYKNGKYDEALAEYSKAIEKEPKPALSAKSRYNMGNAAFRRAGQQMSSDPQAALQSLQESVAFYRRALQDNQSLDPAARNLEVARIRSAQVQEKLKQLAEVAREDQQKREAAAEGLKNLIKEQKAQADQSGRAAKSSLNKDLSGQAEKGRKMADKQDKTGQETRKLSEKMVQTQPASAQKALQQATESQKSASDKLRQGKFAEASADQQKAVDKMQKALDDLSAKESAGDQNKQVGRKSAAGTKATGKDKGEKQGKAAEQAQKQASAKAGPEAMAPDKTVQDILNEEKENKRLRELGTASDYSPVDKDW